jgi:signal transduction histidine kinase
MADRVPNERVTDTATGAAGGDARPPVDGQRRWLLGFLRKLPHDFANAILPFRIAGDLLRRADGDTAIVDQVTRILDDQSANAQRLIDDLDRTVRVVLGELPTRRRPCELGKVVGEGIAAARRHAPPSVEIALIAPPEPIELDADPTQLAAAVEELVDNAARFAGNNPIRVELERAGDDAVIRVRDGGPGIAPDRLEQLFEPFVAANTIDSGWGIGLGFVRLVAAAHGGSIDGTPGTDGSGLVMTLRFPIAR